MKRLVRRVAGMLASIAPGLWAGLILGASFVAVPAVFDVSDALKPFAYGAAARVFARLATAEWAFLALLALSLALLRFPTKRTVAAVMLAALLAAQAIWLRPDLAARAAILASGGKVEPSAAHAVYAILELIKLAWLAGLSYAGRRDAD